MRLSVAKTAVAGHGLEPTRRDQEKRARRKYLQWVDVATSRTTAPTRARSFTRNYSNTDLKQDVNTIDIIPVWKADPASTTAADVARSLSCLELLDETAHGEHVRQAIVQRSLGGKDEGRANNLVA